MSREIKFRAWHKEAKVMLNQPYDGEYISETTSLNSVIKGCQKHENQVLMQYTGLKDKNGVDIYEGDIVKIDDDWEGFGWWASKSCPVVVEDGYFGLKDKMHAHAGYLHDVIGAAKVIGNIYEHGHLLENEE